MKLEYTIKSSNISLNAILKAKLKISERLLSKLIRTNCIYINGKAFDTRLFPNKGDILTIDFGYPEDNSNIVPTKMDLKIIYEDEWLLVVEKNAGITIHPSALYYSNTLSNGIKFYFDSINLKKKIRPVNRLDKNTSGIVVFAKCEYIQEYLSLEMKDNLFKKDYLCICNGFLKEKSGTVNLPIARKENSIIERCVSENGQTAITHYCVLKEFLDKNCSLVKCSLETGRTHQIRVHMSAIGHYLLGDTLYGNASEFIDRQALHCYELKFVHPITSQNLDFISDMPNDFKLIIDN